MSPSLLAAGFACFLLGSAVGSGIKAVQARVALQRVAVIEAQRDKAMAQTEAAIKAANNALEAAKAWEVASARWQANSESFEKTADTCLAALRSVKQ